MMIHAYDLPGLNSRGILIMPFQARLLFAGVMGNSPRPKLWVSFDENASPGLPDQPRTIVVVGTDVPCSDAKTGMELVYLNSFAHGPFMYHVFELATRVSKVFS